MQHSHAELRLMSLGKLVGQSVLDMKQDPRVPVLQWTLEGALAINLPARQQGVLTREETRRTEK